MQVQVEVDCWLEDLSDDSCVVWLIERSEADQSDFKDWNLEVNLGDEWSVTSSGGSDGVGIVRDVLEAGSSVAVGVGSSSVGTVDDVESGKENLDTAERGVS